VKGSFHKNTVILDSHFDMQKEPNQFLKLPGQILSSSTTEQLLLLLSCQTHAVRVLVAVMLPEPQRKPPPNSVQLSAALEVLE
jgi:hypothetical protein